MKARLARVPFTLRYLYMNTTIATLIVQRLKSKTYWAAFMLSALTFIEYNYDVLSIFIPSEYRMIAVIVWPAIMLALREYTTVALAEK